jgi:hypothetical protein
VLDNNDMEILESYGVKEILFKKIPFELRKNIATKYSELCEEINNPQIIPVRRGDNRDILGKRLLEDAIVLGTMDRTINQALADPNEDPVILLDLAEDLLLIAA